MPVEGPTMTAMAGAHERPTSSSASRAGDARLEQWIKKLQYEPKRTYARRYAGFVRGKGTRPQRPNADWAVRVERKVDRLLSCADLGQRRRPFAADQDEIGRAHV